MTLVFDDERTLEIAGAVFEALAEVGIEARPLLHRDEVAAAVPA